MYLYLYLGRHGGGWRRGGGGGYRCLKFPAKLKMLKISPTTRLPPSGASFMILYLYLQSLKS